MCKLIPVMFNWQKMLILFSLILRGLQRITFSLNIEQKSLNKVIFIHIYNLQSTRTSQTHEKKIKTFPSIYIQKNERKNIKGIFVFVWFIMCKLRWIY